MLPLLLTYIIPAAYSLLPETMRSEKATALLIAIALQESKLTARRQTRGPARGFWQFERAGALGALSHRASKSAVIAAATALRYAATASTLQKACEHNDILACALARCYLWTDPEPLPDRHGAEAGWVIYVRTWKPGAITHGTESAIRKRRAEWAQNFATAWKAVQPNGETS